MKVPGGLAFSEFRGYEAWQAISISRNAKVVAVILGNSVMIDAYWAGIPGNGKPVPDGTKMAKVRWIPKQNRSALLNARVASICSAMLFIQTYLHPRAVHVVIITFPGPCYENPQSDQAASEISSTVTFSPRVSSFRINRARSRSVLRRSK